MPALHPPPMMASLTPFPFLAQNTSAHPSVNHLQYSFICDAATYGEATGADLVRLAWVKLIQAYTGEQDVRFLSALTNNTGSYEIWESQVQLRSTTTMRNGFGACRSGSKVDSQVLVGCPNLLVELDEVDCAPELPVEPTVPLQVSFRVDANTSLPFKVHLHAVFASPLSTFHVKRFLAHIKFYTRNLAGQSPHAHVLGLPHLSPEDKYSIAKWQPPPQQKRQETIHGRITEHARRTPHHTAIDSWDGSMTYRQLDSEADRLAGYLSKQGVVPGDNVFIVLSRGTQLPVAMLATLKAGAAAVLVGTGLPIERILSMTNVVGCRFTISSPEHASIAARISRRVVLIDNESNYDLLDSSHHIQAGTVLTAPPQDVVYDTAFLAFTSGSTGTPKAVEIEHHAWCSRYTGIDEPLKITTQSRILMASSFNFFVIWMEVFTTLILGATICIPSQDEVHNDLPGAVRRLKPDYIIGTPTFGNMYGPAEFPSIRYLALGGEQFLASVVDKWGCDDEIRLMNDYGCSETCGENCHTVLNARSPDRRNIGKSTCFRHYVVHPSDHNVLAPIGAVGELLVEGYSLAKGYRNNDQETEKQFINAPAWASELGAGLDGRRWFKTGDLVQYLENGDLLIFGRKDAQLKIRGQRMEPTEVEYHIETLFPDEVSEAVVAKILAGKSSSERLTLYVVLQPSTTRTLPDDEDLRPYLLDLLRRIKARLSDLLPTWMIPTSLQLLSKMPRTGTGAKLSRRLVKEQPVLCSIGDVQGAEAKKVGFVEQKDVPNLGAAFLTRICAKILDIDADEISCDQRVADLGLDSLHALTLVSKAREAGFPVKFADVLSEKTFVELYEALPKERPSNPLGNGAMLKYNVGASTPVTPCQANFLFKFRTTTGNSVFHSDIRFRGNFDPARLERAMRRVIVNADAFRLRFDNKDPRAMTQSLGDWSEENLSRSVVRDDGVDYPDAILQPVHARISKKGGSWHLILRLHHAVFDNLSVQLLMDDLASAYARDDAPDPRPSFWNYLHDRLHRRTAADASYWKELLAGSSFTTLRVPTMTLLGKDGTICEVAFSRVIDLGAYNFPPGITTGIILKAAWGIVLSVMTSSSDVVFGTALHGRDEEIPDSQRIIGCCISMLPIRVQLSEEMGASDLLHTVRQQIVQTMPHAQVGLRYIANQCPTWDQKGLLMYSSFVHHQVWPETKHLAVGETGYMDIGEMEFAGDAATDISFWSAHTGKDALKLIMVRRKDAYTENETIALWEAYLFCIRGLLAGRNVGSLRKELRAAKHFPTMQQQQ